MDFMPAQQLCVSTIARQLGIDQKRFESWKKRLEADQPHSTNHWQRPDLNRTMTASKTIYPLPSAYAASPPRIHPIPYSGNSARTR